MSEGRVSTVRVTLAATVPPLLATVVALPFTESGVSTASIYLVSVVSAAAIGGLRSGVAASALAFLGLNFFFTPPRRTFRIDKEEDLVALVVFLIVAIVVGSLLARALDERERAKRRERETWLLSYLATKLGSGGSLTAVLDDFTEALLEPFTLATCEVRVVIDDAERTSVASREGAVAGRTVEIPVAAGQHRFGTLIAVRREEAAELSGAELQLIEACVRQAASAIERHLLESRAEDSRVEAETNRLRAALFSAVTHDLRTPLASIKASATTLLDDEARLDEAQRTELLVTVAEETDRLNRLVGNLLELAKVRAGALAPSKERIALDEILDAVLHRMRGPLRGTRVRIVVRPEAPEVFADPVQIDQVFTNVLENAAHASPPGGEILVSIAPWHGRVQVRVSDQGPGIPVEDRERVFEPFVRRDPDRAGGGSGLGLAIARAIVLAHGGRIWIDGAPGGGASVVFELPVEGS